AQASISSAERPGHAVSTSTSLACTDRVRRAVTARASGESSRILLRAGARETPARVATGWPEGSAALITTAQRSLDGVLEPVEAAGVLRLQHPDRPDEILLGRPCPALAGVDGGDLGAHVGAQRPDPAVGVERDE